MGAFWGPGGHFWVLMALGGYFWGKDWVKIGLIVRIYSIIESFHKYAVLEFDFHVVRIKFLQHIISLLELCCTSVDTII